MQGDPYLSSSAHKRQRPEWKQGDDDQANKTPNDSCLLTPHTLRLLKVLKDGTCAHAQVAAAHLCDICRQSSPEILWDILGRLQGFLVSEEFTSRQNAATAMKGVAACLPRNNQMEFLEKAMDGETDLWLTLKDLVKIKDKKESGLQTILRKGRLLLVSSGTEFDVNDEDDLFDREQYQVDNLDRSRGQPDFVEQRVRLQRQILAQRLGLAGVMNVVGSSVLPNEITSEDLVGNYLTKKQKAKKVPKSDDNHDDSNSNSIRAILVLEIQDQRNTHRGSASHKNSQTLLATELLYRMFDANWTKRQGAIMGILALLKAWQGSCSTTTFGSWPRDILTRCVCILALDRFEDYGENMVAPVRQVAGQLLAALYQGSPVEVQYDCRTVLIELARYAAEWEVRHGGLIGLTFVVALSDHHDAQMEEIVIVAINCLSDESDDVKGAGAKILMSFVESRLYLNQSQSCSRPLWKAISNVKRISTCANDLVALFSILLCRETELVLYQIEEGLDQVFRKLNEILDYDSMSVKLAAFQALSSLTKPILTLKSLHDINTLIPPNYDLMSYLFETYWNFNAWTDDKSKLEVLKNARDDLWIHAVDQAAFLLQNSNPLPLPLGPRNTLIIRLTLRYFGILHECHSQRRPERLSESPMSHQKHAANALAHFWVAMMKIFDIENFCQSTLYVLIHSPWIFLFESACLLHEAICRIMGFLPWMEACQIVLIQLLHSKPVCIRYVETVSLRIDSSVQGCDNDLLLLLQKVLQGGSEDSTNQLISSWTDSLSMVDTLDASLTIMHMRASTAVARAVVATGREHLPAKLTPLVRTLMTSIKSDADNERQAMTCEAVFYLLQSLTDDKHMNVKTKILSNICTMLVDSPRSLSGIAAALVIKKVVSNVPRDQTLVFLTPIWLLLVPLTHGSMSLLPDHDGMAMSLNVLKVISESVLPGSHTIRHVLESTMVSLVDIACTYKLSQIRALAAFTITSFCTIAADVTLRQSIPSLMVHLKDMTNVAFRIGACKLLHSIIEDVDMEICPFVQALLPIVMSLMADPEEACAKQASQTFAILVRVAPLVRKSATFTWQTADIDDHSESVMEHLIHGRPLPPCEFPAVLLTEMRKTGISLRSYQQEGIAWLRFLQVTKLNGALCDDMGVGKTIQALTAVALAHIESETSGIISCSLVVCPSTLVGLWLNEIKKFFPSDSIFRPCALVGNGKQRISLWRERQSDCNLFVTSYAVLRSDIKLLETMRWQYCILDEGHLLKNPKTATAIAARRLGANHKLIMTGTPVQNHINELWATFDFLLPNFLGSQSVFSKAFARPIVSGQHPGASAEAIGIGMEKLKILHQQVLPFILRREKSQVLKELPPKIITDIPCALSDLQSRIYKLVCEGSFAQKSLAVLQESIEQPSSDSTKSRVELGSEVLKMLLTLRLLCTHPTLVINRIKGLGINSIGMSDHLEASGKLLALNELLRAAGVGGAELTAADNDTSLIYTGFQTTSKDSEAMVLDEDDVDDGLLSTMGSKDSQYNRRENCKCLIFAQFTQSLDVVETLLFQPHMPSLRYLRLDGSTPPEKRLEVVDNFNNDDSIGVLLLTTRVGGLGLNLTSASMVVFLEHDYNPHADLQAADRCYRLGQLKTVNVYRLITTDTIEEKIRALQKVKLAMSDAIVNSDNSSMYSMGTDRLLDIFTYQSGEDGRTGKNNVEGLKKRKKGIDIDAIDEFYNSNEYDSLSVQEFVKDFKGGEKDLESADLNSSA